MLDVKITLVTHLLVVTPGTCKNRLRCSKWITHGPTYHLKCNDIVSNLIGHFLWSHPVYNQWDKISYFSVTNVAVVRYWGMGRHINDQIWDGVTAATNRTELVSSVKRDDNKLRSFSTPSAARFLKTSPATLNEIIWSVKLITLTRTLGVTV